jgi:hypothetical protein
MVPWIIREIPKSANFGTPFASTRILAYRHVSLAGIRRLAPTYPFDIRVNHVFGV